MKGDLYDSLGRAKAGLEYLAALAKFQSPIVQERRQRSTTERQKGE